MGNSRESESIQRINFREYILWFILAGTFLAAYLPVLNGLIHAWSSSAENSHGFLVLPIVFFILWLRRESISVSVTAGSWIGLAVSVLSLAAYLFARASEILTLASISMICFICGSVMLLFGFRLFSSVLFPIFLLFFMIPVPAQIQATLTIPLQLLVTKAVVTLSGFAGIPLYREGNIIFHTKGTFEVVRACSGLRSITSLVMLGTVFGYVSLKSNTVRLLLFASAVPIAVAVNILRVFFMVAALHFFSFDLTRGTVHTVLGMVLFGLALGLFLLIRRVLSIWER